MPLLGRPLQPSELLRIAFFGEGETDHAFVDAVIYHMIANRRKYKLFLIQPNRSVAHMPSGWEGTYRAILDNRTSGQGPYAVGSDLERFHMIIIHLDADVAYMDFDQAHVPRPYLGHLPCAPNALRCPHRTPPRDPHLPCNRIPIDIKSLRKLLRQWMGTGPFQSPYVVPCIPAQNMDAWILSLLAPDHEYIQAQKIECFERLKNQVCCLPKNIRIHYSSKEFNQHLPNRIASSWGRVLNVCCQARHFCHELDFCFKYLHVY